MLHNDKIWRRDAVNNKPKSEGLPEDFIPRIIESMDESMDRLWSDMLVEHIASGIHQPATTSDQVKGDIEEEEGD